MTYALGLFGQRYTVFSAVNKSSQHWHRVAA